MAFEFKKLEEQKKPLYVANQLMDAIKSGRFEAGDKLPTEEELADMTGVSRASVREALAALRLGGVVRTKVGRGTFIDEVPVEENIKEKIINILVDNPKPLELQEARTAFESGVVEVAADKFTKADKEEIDETLTNMEKAARDDDYQEFLNLHKEFHLEIGKATQNEVIEDTLRNLQGIMNEKMWRKLEKRHYLPDKRNYLLESVEIHRDIFSAVKAHNPELARKRMNEHFSRYS